MPLCRRILSPAMLMAVFALLVRTVAAAETPADQPAAGGPAPAAAVASLIPNGDFEAAKDGKPEGWGLDKHVSWLEDENANHFLRLKSLAPDKMFMVYRVVPIPEGVRALKLAFRGRVADLKRGKQMWYDARIIMNFKDADGKKLANGVSVNFGADTKDWVERSIEFLVPEGAKTMEFMPCLFNVKSGLFDLDDIRLVPVAPEPIMERMKAEAEQRAADIAARAALVKPQVEPAPPGKLPPALHVAGNRLETADGKPVWLQGLCIDSMEWSAGGERILQSIGVAINDWKANCIRLPVREHFYAGTGPWQRDGGAAYRQLIEDAANLCGASGVYLVIDLHRFHAPEEKDAVFWKTVADAYKNQPHVLFELFNEPHDLSWKVWRDGGLVASDPKDAEALEKGDDKVKTFESIGMQKLVDTVRGTGAKNVVIAGGIGWSYDVTGALKGFALDDRGGSGIVYSVHVYPWKKDWEKYIVEPAAKFPLFIGEVGNPARWEDFSFVPKSEQYEPVGPESAWPNDVLALIQKYKLNWTAFSFHPKCGPQVILDWDYTPTPSWGVFVKEALAGKQFELKKMR